MLGLWFQIPPGDGGLVPCVCYLLSARSLCVGLISRQVEFQQVWRVCCSTSENKIFFIYFLKVLR